MTALTLWFTLVVSLVGLPALLALALALGDAWAHRSHPLDYDGYCVRCMERRLALRQYAHAAADADDGEEEGR